MMVILVFSRTEKLASFRMTRFAVVEGETGFIETEDDRGGVGHAESIGKFQNLQYIIKT
jgi:hypothetical protein